MSREESAKMPGRSGISADTEPDKGRRDDPFCGRQPTSHEGMTGLPWDASYHGGSAPWDIGYPQPALVRLASEGGFANGGPVLDGGCGTGENALHIAALGLPVLGVDVAETAIAIAQQKAEANKDSRKLQVEFAVADAFELHSLSRKFRTVFDCGLFHTFDANERAAYVLSLASVTERDAILHVLCFSDQGPEIGPHPVREEQLWTAFNSGTGWDIVSIKPERIHTRFHGENGAPAWLATIKRIG
jgi:SAM-dependent methyltransferase